MIHLLKETTSDLSTFGFPQLQIWLRVHCWAHLRFDTRDFWTKGFPSYAPYLAPHDECQRNALRVNWTLRSLQNNCETVVRLVSVWSDWRDLYIELIPSHDPRRAPHGRCLRLTHVTRVLLCGPSSRRPVGHIAHCTTFVCLSAGLPRRTCNSITSTRRTTIERFRWLLLGPAIHRERTPEHLYFVHCVQATHKHFAVLGVFWRWPDIIPPIVTAYVRHYFCTLPYCISLR